jgi:nitrate/nitrite transporter NarK
MAGLAWPATLQMNKDLHFSATVHGLGGGLFFGPYAWGLARDRTGTYQLGLLSLSVCFAIATVLLLVMKRRARSLRSVAPTAASVA